MTEKPAITSFSFPSNFWITGLMIGFLIYTSIPLSSPYFSRQVLEPAAMVRNATGGWKTIKAAWIFTIIAHALEAAYQWSVNFREVSRQILTFDGRSRCTRNQTPLMPKLAFTLTTFVFGFPGLLEFQRLAIVGSGLSYCLPLLQEGAPGEDQQRKEAVAAASRHCHESLPT